MFITALPTRGVLNTPLLNETPGGYEVNRLSSSFCFFQHLVTGTVPDRAMHRASLPSEHHRRVILELSSTRNWLLGGYSLAVQDE